jgi:acyl dehydratase
VLSVGHALRERRRFTEADVAAYAAVSGDRNLVHLDDAVARELGGFERGRVVHGMLVASLFPSIIAARFVRLLFPCSFLTGISSSST